MGVNVSILLDTGATLSFLSLSLVEWLQVKTKEAVKAIDIKFVQEESASSSVAPRVEFKSGGELFKENLTVCKLGVVDVILGNTFIIKYGIEIKCRTKVKVV